MQTSSLRRHIGQGIGVALVVALVVVTQLLGGCSRSESPVSGVPHDAAQSSRPSDGSLQGDVDGARAPNSKSGAMTKDGTASGNGMPAVTNLGTTQGNSSTARHELESYDADIIQSLIAPNLWTWETQLEWARQRPAALLIACNDYARFDGLKLPVDDSLALAGRLAECGYDVKLLVGVLPTHDHASHPLLDNVRAQIARINERLAQRNQAEANQLEANRLEANKVKSVPLRLIDAPEVFVDDISFWLKYEQWLANTFGRYLLEGAVEESIVDSTKFMLARPPFGFAYLGGHGVEGNLGVKFVTPLETRLASPQSPVTDDATPPSAGQEVTVRTMSRMAAKKYHAPLWMVVDLCRVKAKSGQVIEEPKFAGESVKLSPRQLEYPANFPAALVKVVEHVESLRSTAVVGSLLTDSHANSSRKYSATVLFPDSGGEPIEDQQGLAPRLAQILQIVVPPSGTPYFAELARPDGAITTTETRPADNSYDGRIFTLHELFERSRRLLIEKNANVNPDPKYGPIGREMVVASSARGFRYERVDQHLFGGGLQVDELHTGFTVRHDAAGEIPVDHIEIQRDQVEFNSDFKAVVKLKEPVSVPEGAWKLVLQVWAKSPQPNDGLSFIVGVYDNAGAVPRQLTTHFVEYAKAQCYGSPLPCDGRPRFVEVPLDGEIVPSTKISSFEIQANPQLPESWRKGSQLCITFAALIPVAQDAETINSDLRVHDHADKFPDLLSTWWADTLLGREGEGVVIGRAHSISQPALDMTFHRVGVPASGVSFSGCTGELYPRQFVSTGRHVLRFKVQAETSANPRSSVAIIVYGGRQVLAAWHGAASAARDGIVIPIAATGVANEVALVANDVGKLKIEELRFERAP